MRVSRLYVSMKNTTPNDATQRRSPPDDLLTFDELAAKLKIGRQTVPRLLRRYKSPSPNCPTTHSA